MKEEFIPQHRRLDDPWIQRVTDKVRDRITKHYIAKFEGPTAVVLDDAAWALLQFSVSEDRRPLRTVYGLPLHRQRDTITLTEEDFR